MENIGIYNFCTSVISYFALAAGLGISTYAVREGARYRNDQKQMSEFASEAFSINLISTLLSYIVLLLCVFFISRLREDAPILITLSLNIIFTTIGCEWIFTIYEDFAYITVRSIAFQALSLILMFIFVRSEQDLLPYTTITVISNSGANVINAFSRRKYCRIRFTINRNMLKRLVPVLVLFANSIATTIYVSSDTTMLGILAGNRATGLYSVAAKIYDIVKQLLAAIIIVSIPRLSAYLGENKIKEFHRTGNQILNALIVLVIPAMIGIFMLSRNIILVISGREYAEASNALRLLSIALLFSVFSWFYTSCVLIPWRRENKVLTATIVAAAANIGLNFILIPVWKQNAAAVTTVIAELISLIICVFYGRKLFRAEVSFRDIGPVAIGCTSIALICMAANRLFSSVFLSTGAAVVVSVVVYMAILTLCGNKSVKFLLEMLKHR